MAELFKTGDIVVLTLPIYQQNDAGEGLQIGEREVSAQVLSCSEEMVYLDFFTPTIPRLYVRPTDYNLKKNVTFK